MRIWCAPLLSPWWLLALPSVGGMRGTSRLELRQGWLCLDCTGYKEWLKLAPLPTGGQPRRVPCRECSATCEVDLPGSYAGCCLTYDCVCAVRRYADKASMELGLLFTCRLGNVDLDRPVGGSLRCIVLCPTAPVCWMQGSVLHVGGAEGDLVLWHLQGCSRRSPRTGCRRRWRRRSWRSRRPPSASRCGGAWRAAACFFVLWV